MARPIRNFRALCNSYKHLSVHCVIFMLHPVLRSRLSDSWRGERNSAYRPSLCACQQQRRRGCRLAAVVGLLSVAQHLHSILGKRDGRQGKKAKTCKEKKAPQYRKISSLNAKCMSVEQRWRLFLELPAVTPTTAYLNFSRFGCLSQYKRQNKLKGKLKHITLRF